MAITVQINSSDWVDMRTRGYAAPVYLANTVGPNVVYSFDATPTTATDLPTGSAVYATGTYLWVRGFGDVTLYAPLEYPSVLNRSPKLPPSGSIPYVLSFPDFAPSILASFVNGTTAAQVGNTVTVTAAAHGIVGSTTKNGYRIYFPGSPNIPAGWYSGFAWIDANTVTFTNPVAQTVSSESVNGGLAYTAATTICSLVLPGGSMGPNGRITLASLHSGDATSGSKFLRMVLGGSVLHSITLGSMASWWSRQAVTNNGIETKQVAAASADGVASGSAFSSAAINTTLDQTVSATITLGTALWASLDSAELEVLKR